MIKPNLTSMQRHLLVIMPGHRKNNSVCSKMFVISLKTSMRIAILSSRLTLKQCSQLSSLFMVQAMAKFAFSYSRWLQYRREKKLQIKCQLTSEQENNEKLLIIENLNDLIF